MIVTGVGKSGHIGSKIAATLASTGTPAFFVHPAEANHGDLGMIARDDAIIAMSWSGESFELKGIVAYSRRFAHPADRHHRRRQHRRWRARPTSCCAAARAGSLPARAGADHLDAAAAGDRRRAGRGAARGARLHARPFPHLPSGRPARRQPDAWSARSCTPATRLPLVPLGTQDAGRDDDAVARSASAASASSTRRAGWSASSPTATSPAISHRNLVETCGRRDHDRKPKTVKPQTLASAALGLLNEHNISALIVVDDERPVGSSISTICCGSARPNRRHSSKPRIGHDVSRFDDQFEIGGDGRLDAHLRAGRQVGPGDAPQRVADADAAAAVLDRLGQRRDAGRSSARRAG